MYSALWNDGKPLIQWGVVIGAALTAAVWDLARGKVPNLLTGPLFIAAMIFAGASAGARGLGDSVLGSITLAAPYVVLFLFARGGAGDAKLMGAIGAWLGAINGVIALFCVAVAGVILAVGLAVLRRQRPTSPAGCGAVRPFEGRGLGKAAGTMPYGVAVFIGVCIAAAGVLAWRA